MKKVFIDGSSGTTGLRIRERLAAREDIELMLLPEEQRKDTAARKEALNSADIAFLCLPDDAAREAVTLVENPDTVVIDTSTAHRTSPEWVYGFAEITGRETIKTAKRIANPGCHASGFVALIAPLIAAGALKKEARLSCFSLTGYSGGGKKMIADYENPQRSPLLGGPRQYALSQQHKHLKEMTLVSGLDLSPAFLPVVGDFYSGMEVSVPVFQSDLTVSTKEIAEVYRARYAKGLVFFNENADEEGFLSAVSLQGRDDMEISVYGNEEHILLVSRFDNLGKGASGAAIQNMNLVLGAPENTGLCVKGERL